MEEYTEEDMIKFGAHIHKKKNYQSDLDIEWELSDFLGGESIKKLNIAFVSGSACSKGFKLGYTCPFNYSKCEGCQHYR